MPIVSEIPDNLRRVEYKRSTKRGRIFAEDRYTQEELDEWEAQREEKARKGYPRFQKLQKQFINTHPNWYIAIEVNCGYYLLDEDLENLFWRIKRYCPKVSSMMIYQINEDGTCGNI